MKRIFELFIILIIFYGVYSAFDQIAAAFWENPSTFAIIVVSLIVSIIILSLHTMLVRQEARQKLKTNIDDLKYSLDEKNQELKNAFKVKHEVEDEAEKVIARANLDTEIKT